MNIYIYEYNYVSLWESLFTKQYTGIAAFEHCSFVGEKTGQLSLGLGRKVIKHCGPLGNR